MFEKRINKYKSWDKFTKKMWQWEECNAFDTRPGSIKDWFTDSDLTPLQYTGINDMYDNELYEGDICWDAHHEIFGTIIFEEGAFRYVWDNISESLYEVADTIELRGNIFEDAKLVSLL